MKTIIALLVLSATLTGALAFNYGGDGSSYGHMGASVGAGTTVPLTPCTSTGVYDLSNTCNDIYFIGALK